MIARISTAKKTKTKTKTKKAKTNDPGPLPVMDMDVLRSEWRAIVRSGRALDYEGSKFMDHLYSSLRDDKRQLGNLMVGCLGEKIGSRGKYLTRIDGYRAFPSQDLWQAVSWEGINALKNAKLGRRQASRAVAALLAVAAEHGGVIPNGKRDEAFAAINVPYTATRGKSKANMALTMIADQLQEALDSELVTRGLVRQIFTEDVLNILVKKQSKKKSLAGV